MAEIIFSKNNVGLENAYHFGDEDVINFSVAEGDYCHKEWSATGGNYEFLEMSGTFKKGITFAKKFMSNDYSKWKIWPNDSPDSYQYITLTKDSEIVTGKTDTVDNSTRNYIIKVMDNNDLTIGCCETSGSVVVDAYCIIEEYNNAQGANNKLPIVPSIKVVPIINNISFTCQNRNNLSGETKASKVVNWTGTFEYEISNNCDGDTDINNIIHFTYDDDTSVFSEYVLTQKTSIIELVFDVSKDVVILPFSANTTEDIQISAKTINGCTLKDTFPPEGLYTKDFSSLSDESIFELSEFNEDDNNVYNTTLKTLSINTSNYPRYGYATFENYFSDDKKTIYISQRGAGDSNSENYICIGFDKYNDDDNEYKLGGIVSCFVGSIGVKTKYNIGYDLNEKNELVKKDNCATLNCINYDSYNVFIEDLWVLKQDSYGKYVKHVLGGPNDLYELEDVESDDKLSFDVFATYSSGYTSQGPNIDKALVFNASSECAEYLDNGKINKIVTENEPENFSNTYSVSKITSKKGYEGRFNSNSDKFMLMNFLIVDPSRIEK